MRIPFRAAKIFNSSYFDNFSYTFNQSRVVIPRPTVVTTADGGFSTRTNDVDAKVGPATRSFRAFSVA